VLCTPSSVITFMESLLIGAFFMPSSCLASSLRI
jgi:hypothetical protein